MAVGSIAEVDARRCNDVANSLTRIAVPVPQEETPPLGLAPESEANFWLFLVAICHQTSPVGKPPVEGKVDGIERRGWDFLLHSFRLAVARSPDLLDPRRWKQFTENDIVFLFGTLITEPGNRAALIRNLGLTMDQLGWASIWEAGNHCQFRISGQSPNLLETLASFEAFRDPVEKKSAFFLALMANAKLWSYQDEQNLPAPVDYHEMRGHIRLGTVRLAPEITEKVRSGQLVTCEEDVLIRRAVREAISKVASLIGKSPNALHYFFWNLFRTYCIRSIPACNGENWSRLPEKYSMILQNEAECECPFRSHCESANQSDAINEPLSATEFY